MLELFRLLTPEGSSRIAYARSGASSAVAVVPGPGGKLVSARSKTGDASCSQAASEWRRRQPTSETHKVLARCRAQAATRGAAHHQRLAGHEAKAQVLEHRALAGKVGVGGRKELAESKKHELAARRLARSVREHERAGHFAGPLPGEAEALKQLREKNLAALQEHGEKVKALPRRTTEAGRASAEAFTAAMQARQQAETGWQGTADPELRGKLFQQAEQKYREAQPKLKAYREQIRARETPLSAHSSEEMTGQVGPTRKEVRSVAVSPSAIPAPDRPALVATHSGLHSKISEGLRKTFRGGEIDDRGQSIATLAKNAGVSESEVADYVASMVKRGIAQYDHMSEIDAKNAATFGFPIHRDPANGKPIAAFRIFKPQRLSEMAQSEASPEAGVIAPSPTPTSVRPKTREEILHPGPEALKAWNPHEKIKELHERKAQQKAAVSPPEFAARVQSAAARVGPEGRFGAGIIRSEAPGHAPVPAPKAVGRGTPERAAAAKIKLAEFRRRMNENMASDTGRVEAANRAIQELGEEGRPTVKSWQQSAEAKARGILEKREAKEAAKIKAMFAPAPPWTPRSSGKTPEEKDYAEYVHKLPRKEKLAEARRLGITDAAREYENTLTERMVVAHRRQAISPMDKAKQAHDRLMAEYQARASKVEGIPAKTAIYGEYMGRLSQLRNEIDRLDRERRAALEQRGIETGGRAVPMYDPRSGGYFSGD